jgi:hypothetical protein
MKTETGPPAARRLRWALLLACAVLAAGPAGCSDNGADRKKPADPLAGALSYLRTDSAAVFVVTTDRDSGPLAQLDELGSRFKRWRSLKKRIESSIGLAGLDLRQLRPQLGNPLALAVAGDGHRVGAVRVRDPKALRSAGLARVDAGRAERLADHAGATLWKEKGAARGALAYSAAVDSDLVVAQSEQDLKDAIDAAGGSENLASGGTFFSTLKRLDADSLLRAVGDLQRLLASSDPDRAADARKIPWVRALGTFTAVSKVSRQAITTDLRLRTDRVRLSDDQLPLAPGPRPPRLHDPGATDAIAVRKPEQLIRFLRRSLAVSDPGAAARLGAGIDQLRAFFGVSVNRDLLAKVTNLSVARVSSRTTTFEGRLEPGARLAFARALDRSQPLISGIVGELVPGTSIQARGAGDSRVWLVRSRGLTLARYAVRGDALIGSVGSGGLPVPSEGKRLRGVSGALAVKGDPARIVPLAGLLPGIPAELLDIVPRLGGVRLGVRAETGELTLRAQLRVGR